MQYWHALCIVFQLVLQGAGQWRFFRNKFCLFSFIGEHFTEAAG